MKCCIVLVCDILFCILIVVVVVIVCCCGDYQHIIVGDIARLLGKPGLSPHADELYGQLISLLTSSHVKKKVKPQIIYCLGDICWALGSGLVQYYECVMCCFRTVAKNIMMDIKKESRAPHAAAVRKVDMKFTWSMTQSLLVALSCATQAIATSPGMKEECGCG